MAKGGPQTVTGLLHGWQEGDEKAFEELVPLVYEELRQLAAREFRRERPNHTLQPTVLVHEVYERLLDGITVPLTDRAHFFAIAATVMRRVLVEHARARKRDKRPGPYVTVWLDDAEERGAREDPTLDFIMLHEALEKLAARDELEARVIELRYFGGLTVQETATELGVTVWRIEEATRHAWAWLRRAMGVRP